MSFLVSLGFRNEFGLWKREAAGPAGAPLARLGLELLTLQGDRVDGDIEARWRFGICFFLVTSDQTDWEVGLGSLNHV